MSYRACIFDLDGTLCDSVESIAWSGNHMLADLGMRQAKIVEDAQRTVGRAVVADDNFIDGAGLGADGGKLLGEKALAVIGAHGDGAEHNRPPWRM